MPRPLIALTQGDPAGVGPEICLREAERWSIDSDYVPLLILEPEAVSALTDVLPEATNKVRFVDSPQSAERGSEAFVGRCLTAGELGLVPAVKPQVRLAEQSIEFGAPGPTDARGALAAINLAVDLCLDRTVQAMVTGPVNKAVIAQTIDDSFRGHTDHIAQRCADRLSRPARYGRDYLMAFLSSQLKVALLSTHEPLQQAIAQIDEQSVVEALRCLDRSSRTRGQRGEGKRIALAGLNPHAGEGGLMGREDVEILVPAVARARQHGVDVVGPESADTVFARAIGGEFDWVLALYHDQGLIAVKTLAFGEAVNWTAGLPIIRTSVDHGTAYAVAGQGKADAGGLFSAVDAAVEMAV